MPFSEAQEIPERGMNPESASHKFLRLLFLRLNFLGLTASSFRLIGRTSFCDEVLWVPDSPRWMESNLAEEGEHSGRHFGRYFITWPMYWLVDELETIFWNRSFVTLCFLSRSKKLLGAKGIATRSKDATRGSWHRY